jgi:hypothetical protein
MTNLFSIPSAKFGATPIVEPVKAKAPDEKQTLTTLTLCYMAEKERNEVFHEAGNITRSILAASLSYFADWINANPHAANIAKDDKAWSAAHKDSEKALMPEGQLPSYRQAKTAVKNWLKHDVEALQGDHVLCTTDGELTPMRILKAWAGVTKAEPQTVAEKVDDYLSKDNAPTAQEFITELADNGTCNGVDLIMVAIAKLGEGQVRAILADRIKARRKEAKAAIAHVVAAKVEAAKQKKAA